MLLLAVTLLVAWGALSFGAVYEWAALPLAAGVAAVGVSQYRPRGRPDAVGLCAGLVVLATLAQLIPLAPGLLERCSPAAVAFLRAFDIAFVTGPPSNHPLSVRPLLTARAVGYLLLWIVWAATVASMVERGISLRRIARNVAVVAAVIAVLGLAQKATFNGKLLWFWTPEYFATNSFGPFVNRNHFAGWMLLPLGLTLGLVLGHISRSAPDLGATWRDRLLWLGTAAASPVLLASSALIAIACSLVWTMSRSGMLGAVVVVTMFTAAALWRVRGGVRVVVASGAVALVAGVVAWRGPATLVNWYGRTATFDWRLQLWADTLPVLRDFWLTGSGLNTYGQLMLIRPLTDTRLDPVQAHNDYLQLAVEGGLLVTLPALLLVGAVGHRIWRALRMPQDPMTWWIRLGATAGIAGIAVQEIAEFSLQIPGVALLFATCVGLAVHEPAPRSRRRSHDTVDELPPAADQRRGAAHAA